MVDESHPRHLFKTAAQTDDLQEGWARYFSHPVDQNGDLLPEQPSAEESAQFDADAKVFARWSQLLNDLAPDVARDTGDVVNPDETPGV